MRLVTWNVNGIRAVLKKGTFQSFLETHDPDILCLQETKAERGQVEVDVLRGGDRAFEDEYVPDGLVRIVLGRFLAAGGGHRKEAGAVLVAEVVSRDSTLRACYSIRSVVCPSCSVLSLPRPMA